MKYVFMNNDLHDPSPKLKKGMFHNNESMPGSLLLGILSLPWDARPTTIRRFAFQKCLAFKNFPM